MPLMMEFAGAKVKAQISMLLGLVGANAVLWGQYYLYGGFVVDDDSAANENAAADAADGDGGDATAADDDDCDDDVDDDFHILVVRWVRRMRLVPAGTVADYSNV